MKRWLFCAKVRIPMQVSITFCGGCNPQIDRSGLAERLKNQLGQLGMEVTYNNVNADFIVFLSGCPVSCASRKIPDYQACVRIAGYSLNSLAVTEGDLARIKEEKVKEYYKI